MATHFSSPQINIMANLKIDYAVVTYKQLLSLEAQIAKQKVHLTKVYNDLTKEEKAEYHRIVDGKPLPEIEEAMDVPDTEAEEEHQVV